MADIVTDAMDGTHWAMIASGVGGIATAGALLASLLLLRGQVRGQRQAQADRHREHASHIAFWVEPGQYDPRAPQSVTIVAHYANTSVQPAMNVLMVAGLRRDVWDGHPDFEDMWDCVVIAPQVKSTHTFTLSPLPTTVFERAHVLSDLVIIGEMLFTDASGVSWLRTSSGLLIEEQSPVLRKLTSVSLSEREEALSRASQTGLGHQHRRRPIDRTSL